MAIFITFICLLFIFLAGTYLKEKFEKIRLWHSNLDYVIFGLILAILLNEGQALLPAPVQFEFSGWIPIVTLMYGIIFGSRILISNFIEKTSDEWKMVYFPILFTAFPIIVLLIIDQYFRLNLSSDIWLWVVAVGLILLSNSREYFYYLLKNNFDIPPVLTKQFNMLSITKDTLVILLFGLFAAYMSPVINNLSHMSPVEWIVLSIVLGTSSGWLGIIMFGDETNYHAFATIVIVHIMVLSGIAYYLKFSPLFIGMLWGLVVINFYSHRHDFTTFLYRFERPVFILMYIASGLLIDYRTLHWSVLIAIGYIGIRWLIQHYASKRAYYSSQNPIHWTENFGDIFMGQGILALSISMNMVFISSASFSHIIHGAVVIGVMFYQYVTLSSHQKFIREYISG